MKRFSIFIMALLAMLMMSSSVLMGMGRKDNSLVELWLKYEKASEKDRIQDMADILEDVKAEALAQRASWDYFRACDEYVDVKSRRNWKLTDSLMMNAKAELHEYGVPALEILFGLRHGESDEILTDLIDDNEAEMKKTSTSGLYGQDRMFNGHDDYYDLRKFHKIGNDYEFILWMARHYRGLGGGWPYDRLESYYGNNYPVGPYVRFLKLRSGFDRDGIEHGLKRLMEENAGLGIGLLAEDSYLEMRLDDMGQEASSEEYRELERDILELREAKSRMKGADHEIADLCVRSGYALDRLRSKNVWVGIEDGVATLELQNLDKVKLRILKDGKTVFEAVAVNEVGSFFRPDTVRVAIPDLPDGGYVADVYDGNEVIGGCGYEKYTLSLAYRFGADGMCVYAADYMTGEPVGKADLILYDSDRNPVSEIKDFAFDGFTPLPEGFCSLIGKNGTYLRCRCGDGESARLSMFLRIWYHGSVETGSSSADRQAMVMKDRGAYVPGDTVKYKAVLYQIHPDGMAETLPAGFEVKVRMQDRRGDIVSEEVLAANEFGSVSGSFAIGRNVSNGLYSVTVHDAATGEELGSSRLDVDEYVLPSYDLVFDEPEKLWFPGDTVRVTGRVVNYSGHGFVGLKAEASVRLDGEQPGVVPLALASDGSFELSFLAGAGDDAYVGCTVNVKLVDSTGETLEFNHFSSANARFTVTAELLNGDTGEYRVASERGLGGKPLGILSGKTAEIRCITGVYGNPGAVMPVSYKLMNRGKLVLEGVVMSGRVFSMDMSALDSGLYELELMASSENGAGRKFESSGACHFLYMPDNGQVVAPDVDVVLRYGHEDGAVVMQLGSGTEPLWAAVELFGENRTVLKKEFVRIDEPGSSVTVSCPYLSEYPDKVMLNVFFFRNGSHFHHGEWISRPENPSVLPLEFISFTDKALPGQDCTVRFRTDSDSEVLAAVFDLSSEKVYRNIWDVMLRRNNMSFLHIHYSAADGCDSGGAVNNRFFSLSDVSVVAYGTARKSAGMTGAVEMSFDSAENEEEVFADGGMDMVRDDFAATLAFEPYLHPLQDGTVELKFRTSDKLSTFAVRAMAHDRDMNTALVEKEMIVTLPVKVSVMAPQYLYEGDRYVLRASVSNASGTALKGCVHLGIYDGEEYLDVDPVRADSVEVEVPAGGAADVAFDVPVPESVDTLGFKVVFEGYGSASDGAAVHDVLISDGMFVPVPVYPAAQVLTEAHSAVVLAGESVEEVVERLRKQFVNVSSVGAEYEAISIMDMIRDAVPGAVVAGSANAVSLSEAMYVNMLAYGLNGGKFGLAEDEPEARACVDAMMDSVAGLLKCANADGGFGWFEGMPSSPLLTAFVLEKFSAMDGEDLAFVSYLKGEDALDDMDAAMVAAVKYLDEAYFREFGMPFWDGGGLLTGQYINVRSKFAGVPFDADAAKAAAGAKNYRKFTRSAKEFMYSAESLSGGAVSSKIFRISALDNLMGSAEGMGLAKAWGLTSEPKMRESLRSNLESLKQYAVEHSPGVYYYPNAVMPWRGLLETEAYVHALIADIALKQAILEKDPEWIAIARGLRVWMMLQKETQEWSSDPGFVDAVAAVMNDSPEAMIVVMKKRYAKPFDEIEAAGNGFKVSVDYYRAEPDGGRVRLSEADSLHVGDKITAVYSLWSQENRSHVRLSVPRAACFRPVGQVSGWSGGWFRPVSYGHRKVSPYSYREVKADRTLYWIDVFPEEKTTVEEELFVTQEGCFTVPVAEIECMYASHYRANGSSVSKLCGKR